MNSTLGFVVPLAMFDIKSFLAIFCPAFKSNFVVSQVGEVVTGWIHSAMWNNASHLAMIMFFVANTLFELGFFYKVGLSTFILFMILSLFVLL